MNRYEESLKFSRHFKIALIQCISAYRQEYQHNKYKGDGLLLASAFQELTNTCVKASELYAACKGLLVEHENIIKQSLSFVEKLLGSKHELSSLLKGIKAVLNDFSEKELLRFDLLELKRIQSESAEKNDLTAKKMREFEMASEKQVEQIAALQAEVTRLEQDNDELKSTQRISESTNLVQDYYALEKKYKISEREILLQRGQIDELKSINDKLTHDKNELIKGLHNLNLLHESVQKSHVDLKERYDVLTKKLEISEQSNQTTVAQIQAQLALQAQKLEQQESKIKSLENENVQTKNELIYREAKVKRMSQEPLSEKPISGLSKSPAGNKSAILSEKCQSVVNYGSPLGCEIHQPHYSNNY